MCEARLYGPAGVPWVETLMQEVAARNGLDFESDFEQLPAQPRIVGGGAAAAAAAATAAGNYGDGSSGDGSGGAASASTRAAAASAADLLEICLCKMGRCKSKSVLKAPGYSALQQSYDELLSSFAINSNFAPLLQGHVLHLAHVQRAAHRSVLPASTGRAM